jgi:hypothetical protein
MHGRRRRRRRRRRRQARLPKKGRNLPREIAPAAARQPAAAAARVAATVAVAKIGVIFVNNLAARKSPRRTGRSQFRATSR